MTTFKIGQRVSSQQNYGTVCDIIESSPLEYYAVQLDGAGGARGRYWFREDQLVAVGTTDTSFDDPFGDEPTLPGYAPLTPDERSRLLNGIWTPYKEGDELDRTCKGCKNKSMRAVRVEGDLVAFCRLCGRKEAL